MFLIDLPEEILIIIIRELDFISTWNLYNSCRKLRNIVCMYRVITECHMSMNTLATVRTLKLSFFKAISGHLLILNMSGVPDLSKSWLLPAMKKLKNLQSLNISFTNINIVEFLEIYEVCPTVKKICINFVFGKSDLVKVSQKTILQCQEVFKNFENVHFVGSLNNLLYSNFALCLLKLAKLHKLEYTIADFSFVRTTDQLGVECNELPGFDTLHVYILNWTESNVYHGDLGHICALKLLNPEDYEFIIISMLNLNTYTIYVSDLFKNFFCDNFNVVSIILTQFNQAILGNIAILMWNKKTTHFDKDFFINLTETVKQYLPSHVLFSGKTTESQASVKNDWFYTNATVHDFDQTETNKFEPETTKRRMVQPKFVLNYDEIFKKNQKAQLSIIFNFNMKNAVALSSSSNYLRKLTYLSLSGIVRYSIEFFDVLFRCSENLVTLNVVAPSISPCASHISRSVPLSRCLKHLRLVDKRIDFKKLFSALSQCKSLENIYIQDECLSNPGDVDDPSIILEKCDYLYNLYIEATMSETARAKKLQLLNKTKARCGKHHLNIELHTMPINKIYRYSYNPFVGVFKLNPIKPLKW